MAGRAGYSRAWVAVEHPGPWPRDAVEAVLAPVITRARRELAGSDLQGVRVVLIRKRAGRTLPEQPRVFLAWAAGGASWIRTTQIQRYEEILDLLGCLSDREPELGERPERTVALVCTHGRRDACCAEFGRPILEALRDRSDTDVWESTHVGGDRFAANLVILPDGLHYSRLTPRDAHLALDAYTRHELHLPSFRGRGSRTMPEQAAEHALRESIGAVGIDDVEILHTTVRDDEHCVTARVAERTLEVRLKSVPVAPGSVIHGCVGDAGPAQWEKWELTSLSEAT